ncbi:MAG: cadmium-translocating P-type ATPase [Clostridiales bacterium]|nr:cadmium-translocating P-type ATPase [Clostridiales bacterium]
MKHGHDCGCGQDHAQHTHGTTCACGHHHGEGSGGVATAARPAGQAVKTDEDDPGGGEDDPHRLSGARSAPVAGGAPARTQVHEGCGCGQDHAQNHEQPINGATGACGHPHGGGDGGVAACASHAPHEDCGHAHTQDPILSGDHARRVAQGFDVSISCGCGHCDDHGHDDAPAGHGHAHEHAHGKAKFWPLGIGGGLFIASLLLRRTAFAAYADYGLLLAYAFAGAGPIRRAIQNIARGQIFDENFLMTIATVGAIVIGDYAEACGVMLFYLVGEHFQDRAVDRSLASINAMMALCPETAILLKDGLETEVPSASLRVGDLVVIRPGDRVPTDCRVTLGVSALNTAALTGESLPVPVQVGDQLLSGAVNLEGVLQAEVLVTADRSTAAKVLELVEQAAAQKAPTEQFITKFSRIYTPVVCALALLTALVSATLLGRTWMEGLYAACVFLVISCPCALVLSVPLGFFAGLGLASSNGVLVKGGNYLEAIGEVRHLVFDKTGTLTTGKLSITAVEPEGVSARELLELASAAESGSTHPVAQAVVAHAGPSPLKLEQAQELPGRGIRCVVEGRAVLCGNRRLMEEQGIPVPEGQGGTAVYLARDGVYIGRILADDTVRADAAPTIEQLRALGLRSVTMLSGDQPGAVEAIALQVGIADTRAGLLPQQKVEELRSILDRAQKGERVAYVGDGINDAPVLAMADIGISMGMGSDAAIEASDVVLMEEKLGGLLSAFKASLATRRVVRQNIWLSLGVKAAVMLLAAAGYANMWAAVFADVGVAMLAILNSARLLKMKL